MATTPPDVLAVLPPPFEWCEVRSSKPVNLHIGEWENFQYVIKDLRSFDVNPFWIAKYPITHQQYKVFLDDTDGYTDVRWWDASGSELAKEIRLANPSPIDIPRDNNRPATHVNFYDAQAFCRWLGSRLQRISMRLELPTELEWQKAAQGDGDRLYPWGNEFDTSRANTRESNIVKTTPVTDYPEGTSPYGVIDMSGNVWEWCIDALDHNKTVLRGGSWRFDARFATTTYRYFYEPDQGHGNIGFRIVTNIIS
jgi:formylglycine-generating enzyme required for sulfatase activity